MKQASKRPEQGLTYEGGRPREEDILTRRRIPLWSIVRARPSSTEMPTQAGCGSFKPTLFF